MVMQIDGALERLRSFDYPVERKGNVLFVEMELRTPANQIYAVEVYAVLKYEVHFSNFTQVDPWTVSISFE
jgi:hypothetical protein